MGSSLNLCGLVLFVSYFSHGHDFGFHFFSFVGGLRGAEPSSLLWGQSFLYRFLIAETLFLMSLALHRREVEKGHTFLSDIASRLAPCSDLSFFL